MLSEFNENWNPELKLNISYVCQTNMHRKVNERNKLKQKHQQRTKLILVQTVSKKKSFMTFNVEEELAIQYNDVGINVEIIVRRI